jgi:hypothetical protein
MFREVGGMSWGGAELPAEVVRVRFVDGPWDGLAGRYFGLDAEEPQPMSCEGGHYACIGADVDGLVYAFLAVEI